ncbi:MAG: ATP-binding protein [Vicinamibacteria bacterium]|nr:ATP-binding protein [Vicinamibacteria bacterium]
MRVVVASGKGGTGKTTVALNLASVVAAPVQLLDCDVEEPNVHLFLEGSTRSREIVSIPVPEADASLCDACGECSRFCQYGAIAVLKDRPLVFAELCHGCGGCVRVCPRRALHEVGRRIGTVEVIAANHVTLIQGRLDVGVAMAPPLIKAVKARMRAGSIAILDAPPGTSCPVIAALRDSDVAVLVTEPTPFGLHDLKLAVETVRAIGVPLGVVVNRVGIGDDRVHAYCSEQSLPVLAEIPDDRRVAEAYSRGEIIVSALPDYRSVFERLWDSVVDLGARQGDQHADV